MASLKLGFHKAKDYGATFCVTMYYCLAAFIDGGFRQKSSADAKAGGRYLMRNRRMLQTEYLPTKYQSITEW